MTVLSNRVPVSDLRQDAAATLERLEHSGAPIVITRKGRAAAVLMSVATYERAEEERLLLRRLAKGEQEIQSGCGHDLEEVLADAADLLRDKSA
ncbi:MAG: type II toxin-antitoxin system Phd/YefM family antitoxin [Magnetococcales bacterium]|nr:type II toxin-antitoxin system Phd/YefM family antitoxin [Magnetococcales bacterium]